MTAILFKNATVVTPDDVIPNASLRVVDGAIESVGSVSRTVGEVIDCDGITMVPGFIDVHIHGSVGVDVNTAGVDGLMDVGRFLARNGVTSWLPTLVPDSDENYARVISTIDDVMEIQSTEPVAQVVGVHYEGVFANENMCGALRPQYFKRFTGAELSALPRPKRGARMTTFAPEVEGGVELARELVRQGWIASIGHTKAPPEILDRAFDAGARHLTHFFNAMTGMHHRNIGVVGWALANRNVTFDIIADGIHVHPAMVEFACRTKSPERVTLISDSVAPTGLGDGEFEIWDERITVTDGQTQNERGSIAGSVITMHDAVKRMRSLGFSASEVSLMASLNPAKLLGIESSRGSIEVGKRADLVGMDSDGNIRLSVVGGRVGFDDR